MTNPLDDRDWDNVPDPTEDDDHFKCPGCDQSHHLDNSDRCKACDERYCVDCLKEHYAQVAKEDDETQKWMHAYFIVVDGLNGHQHWDYSGTHGMNCKLCKSQAAARELAESILGKLL